jgi:RNA polymerase sigma factor (sigma-70 family)
MSYEPRPEEAQLVKACLHGDSRAQRKLYEKYYGKMLGVCLRYTKDREEARDILQDGFVKIFQKLGQFSFSSPLEGWVRRIIVNTAIDRYRKNLAEPGSIDIETVYEVASEEHDALSDMSHEELLSCLQNLPAGYRMVFNMYVIEGFSHKEIAEALTITEGTSKSQLSKARAYLQRLIGNKYTPENG